MRIFIPIIAVLCFCCLLTWGEGSTVRQSEVIYGSMKKIEWRWTSNSVGAATAMTAASGGYSGQVVHFVSIPDATPYLPAGTSYDIIISTTYANPYGITGHDILCANGMTLNSTNAFYVSNATETLGAVAADQLLFSVSNAGNAKKGTSWIFIR